MTKYVLAACAALTLIAATAPPVAAQVRHFLVAEWYENGNHFCRYDDGTVLNVGYRICPMSI